MRIDISGEIVDTQSQKWSEEDCCPQDIRDALENIQDKEDIDIHITSPGGSVFAGNAIISYLQHAQKDGHRVISHVHGIAASMASAIAFAADELVMDDSAVVMLHLPWTMVQGNQNDLQKEIQTLELLTKTLVGIYKTKFPGKTDEEVKDILAAETWILGSEAESYGLVCTIEHAEKVEMKFAARLTKYDYKNIPEELKMKDNNNEHEDIEKTASPETAPQDMAVQEEGIKDEKQETEKCEDTPDKDDTPDEKNEPDIEDMKAELEKAKERISELEKSNDDLTKENEDLKKQLAECGGDEEKKNSAETITKAECEKRVQGMQASMQKQINDFNNQLIAKNEELTKAKAEITSLKDSLEHTSEELKSTKANLEQTASALEEKNKALERLNSGVNAQAEELPTMEEGLRNCSSPEAKVAFLKSGKYVR